MKFFSVTIKSYHSSTFAWSLSLHIQYWGHKGTISEPNPDGVPILSLDLEGFAIGIGEAYPSDRTL